MKSNSVNFEKGTFMPNVKILTAIIIIFFVSGCSTNSELNYQADTHDKAGDYYESIGQPQAAERERSMAQENRDDSLKPEALLSEIFSSKKNK